MNTNLVETAVVNAEATRKIVKIECGEFSGAFKAFGSTAYADLKFYGLDKEVSHKIANDFMSSLGDAMAQDSELSAKVSKAKKEGESRFNISGKSGYVKQSYSMSIVRIAQELDKIRKEALFCKPVNLTYLIEQGFLNKDLVKYIAAAKEWAGEQTWVE